MTDRGMRPTRQSSLEPSRYDNYVVVFFDIYDDQSVSFVLGPYDNLQDAQAGVKRAMDKIGHGFRRYSIQECRTLAQIPEWERIAR